MAKEFPIIYLEFPFLNGENLGFKLDVYNEQNISSIKECIKQDGELKPYIITGRKEGDREIFFDDPRRQELWKLIDRNKKSSLDSRLNFKDFNEGDLGVDSSKIRIEILKDYLIKSGFYGVLGGIGGVLTNQLLSLDENLTSMLTGAGIGVLFGIYKLAKDYNDEVNSLVKDKKWENLEDKIDEYEILIGGKEPEIFEIFQGNDILEYLSNNKYLSLIDWLNCQTELKNQYLSSDKFKRIVNSHGLDLVSQIKNINL